MKPGMIYLISAPKFGSVKIGYTSGDPYKRLSQLQTGCPDQLELVDSSQGTKLQEALYHEAFAKHHIRGEWFTFDDEIYSVFLEVSNWASTIPTKPPLTKKGAHLLRLAAESAGGVRKVYPDGTRHLEIDWDEKALIVEAAIERCEASQ